MKHFLTLFFFSVCCGSMVSAQRIIRVDGKAMLLGPNDKVYASGFDSIVEDNDTFREIFYTFHKDGKQAVVFKQDLETTDWSHFSCRYDRVSPLYFRTKTNSFYIVRNAGRFGVVNNTGAEVVPIQYDSVYPVRNYRNVIVIRRQDRKLDFLDIFTDIDSGKVLTFPYDEITAGKERHFFHLRTGERYGFYYSSRNSLRQTYQRSMIAPAFDSPVEQEGLFFTTTAGSERHYFYEKGLLWNSLETDLYLTENTFFTELETGGSMLITGNNRSERCLLTNEYLYTGIDQTQAIPCYNLRTQEAVPAFEAGYGKTYRYETLLLDHSDLLHEDSMRVYVIRVSSFNGFLPVESFYALNEPRLIFTVELREGQTVRLEEYDRNWHYMAVKIVSARPDEKGHYKNYGTEGYVHASRLEMQTERPPHEDGNFAERWEKNHGGSGGGGGSGWNWLWMGGR
jgi:hypothetical protein